MINLSELDDVEILGDRETVYGVIQMAAWGKRPRKELMDVFIAAYRRDAGFFTRIRFLFPSGNRMHATQHFEGPLEFSELATAMREQFSRMCEEVHNCMPGDIHITEAACVLNPGSTNKDMYAALEKAGVSRITLVGVEKLT